MKIVIAGGGVGGLCLAGLLNATNHDVTVYESAKSLQEMRYDWHDNVSPKAFEDLNIPIPEDSPPKYSCYFISPFNKGKIFIKQPEVAIDLSMERRPLNKILFDRIASEKVVFGASVTKALVDSDKVIGCEVTTAQGTEKVLCDLLVDCCGVNSSVRESLPQTLGIMNKVPKSDVFYTFRAFISKVDDANFEPDNKVYMKHLGENGISWCYNNNHDPHSLDVLVGRTEELSKDTLKRAMDDIKADNPLLGEKVLRGGGIYRIPVRRPLDKLVANGYVLLGDSGCMTVPMIGSGVASSLYAAKILADVITSNNSCEISNLWQYQHQVYKKFGAYHCGVDYMKRWMLSIPCDTVNWLFTSGILTDKDLLGSSSGEMINLSLKDMLQKLVIGIKKLPSFIQLLKVALGTKKAAKVAGTIPEVYSEKAVKDWQDNLGKFYSQP